MTSYRFRAIAWDIDGTLIDSEPLHHQALVAASRSLGADLTARPEGAFIGLDLDQIWAIIHTELTPGTTMESWRALIRHNYALGVSGLKEIEGAHDTVAALAQMGLRQIAVSNSARVVVDANLAAVGVKAQMETSVSVDDVLRGKPDPAPYLRGLELLGLNADQVLAVEDSAPGATAARAAGMQVAGLGAAQTVTGVTPITRLNDLLALVRQG